MNLLCRACADIRSIKVEQYGGMFGALLLHAAGLILDLLLEVAESLVQVTVRS